MYSHKNIMQSLNAKTKIDLEKKITQISTKLSYI